MAERVNIEDLPKRMNQILGDLAKKNSKLVVQSVNDMARGFEERAVRDFTEYMRVRSGQLRSETRGFIRRISDTEIEVGLRNPKKYARPQHEGTGPFVIVPRRRKALRFTVGGDVVFAKRVNHPGIRAKPFLSVPLRFEAEDKLRKLVKEIGF